MPGPTGAEARILEESLEGWGFALNEPVFSRDQLPELEFRSYWKTHPTLAAKVEGTFHCLTSEGNIASCADGWLAIDSRGHPYPVNSEEFAITYVPVDESGGA